MLTTNNYIESESEHNAGQEPPVQRRRTDKARGILDNLKWRFLWRQIFRLPDKRNQPVANLQTVVLIACQIF